MEIYLDHAATTPMSPSALEAYRQAAERFFGNASSLHDFGSEAQRALEGARKAIADVAGISERGIHFTGSGSEANFLALQALISNHGKSGHLITTEFEHSSVRNTFDWLERQGFEVSRLPAGRDGRVNPDSVSAALRENTILVSVQHVNSETGAIQPLERIGKLLSGHPARFHSDLVQSFGKLQLDPIACNLDSFSLSAHKIRGPKGIGAAWIAPSISWRPFIPGSTHEQGFRPGTVDVPAAVSFAVAAMEARKEASEVHERLSGLKQLFTGLLGGRLPDQLSVEGDPAHTSPYITGLRIHGMEGQYAMLECSQRGVAISTGSACQVNEQKPSPALLSMGRSEEEARQFIRVSMGPGTTRQEVERAGGILATVIESYLERSGLSTL